MQQLQLLEMTYHFLLQTLFWATIDHLLVVVVVAVVILADVGRQQQQYIHLRRLQIRGPQFRSRFLYEYL